MKHEVVLETVGRFLEGQGPVESVAKAMAATPHARDAARLAIYERLCVAHRSDAVGSVHAYVRGVVEARVGVEGWKQLHEAFFVAHPMHHVELNENAAQLSTFLGVEETAESGWAVKHGLPSWLGALADFEWWEWQTLIARDEPMDATPNEGPLRLAGTVELRSYPVDFVSWLDIPKAERPPEPEAGQSLVLFWRNADLEARRATVNVYELAVLQAVHAGALVRPEGVSVEKWDETVADLRGARIVLGAVG